MDANERVRLAEQAGFAELDASTHGGYWAPSYVRDVRLLLDALDEAESKVREQEALVSTLTAALGRRNQLLCDWLAEGVPVPACPGCKGFTVGHRDDCPVPATRALLEGKDA